MKIIFVLALLAACAVAWESFAPGEGPFDHMSNEEFAAQYLMPLDSDVPNGPPPSFNSDEFEAEFGHHCSFDWRKGKLSKCVGDIRNQGRCGSCWAHATTEFLSDRYCIATDGKDRVTFAPQYSVDCANKTWDAEGCDGAETQTNLYWLEEFGMVSEECYPYFSGDTETNGTCHFDTCVDDTQAKKYYPKKGSTKLYFNYTNTEIAHDIMHNGPLYFSMVVFGDFKAYKGGVYYPIDFTALGTHAVKCLGWGYDDKHSSYYWICANSWSEDWGEKGFFRIGFNNFIGYKAGSLAMDGHTEAPSLFSK
jgi:cathepsin B